MITLEAPIIPGKSAAGIELEQDLDEAVAGSHIRFTIEIRENSGYVIYRSDSIDVWGKDKRVSQIGLHGAYAGKIGDSVGLGTPIRIASEFLGPLKEDIEDNLVFRGVSGLCVETDVNSALSPITEIYVFIPDLEHEQHDLSAQAR